MNTAYNGDRTPVFLERALNHAYSQLEATLELIAACPKQFRKGAKNRFNYSSTKLHQRKLMLQRETRYLESKLAARK